MKNIYIFRHLKLEIALAIPASNDEKYNWNTSAGQGLTLILLDPYSEIVVSHPKSTTLQQKYGHMCK